MEIPEILSKYIFNKPAALKDIIQDLKQTAYIDTELETIDSNEDLIKIVKQQNLIIQKLLIVSSIYMQGNNYDGDANTFIVKIADKTSFIETIKLFIKNFIR